ncbi:MAG: hypothetical protein ACPGXL_06425, partial [Chitinophagales bacterium]
LKFTEGGSERIKRYFPSFGGGFMINKVGIGVLYHYRNFFNVNYVDETGALPYANYDVKNMLTFSLVTAFN